MVKLVIFLPSVLILKAQEMMKKKNLTRIKNIIKDIKAIGQRGKISIQGKTAPPSMKMIVTVTQERYYSWHLNKMLKTMKMTVKKKEKWILKES